MASLNQNYLIFFTTYYLLLTTHYLLLIHYYLLLTTYYLLINSYYLLLTTHSLTRRVRAAMHDLQPMQDSFAGQGGFFRDGEDVILASSESVAKVVDAHCRQPLGGINPNAESFWDT